MRLRIFTIRIAHTARRHTSNERARCALDEMSKLASDFFCLRHTFSLSITELEAFFRAHCWPAAFCYVPIQMQTCAVHNRRERALEMGEKVANVARIHRRDKEERLCSY